MVDADSDPLPEQTALSNLAFAPADSEIRSSYDTAEPILAPRAGRRVMEVG
jgi:hypothetical protein